MLRIPNIVWVSGWGAGETGQLEVEGTVWLCEARTCAAQLGKGGVRRREYFVVDGEEQLAVARRRSDTDPKPVIRCRKSIILCCDKDVEILMTTFTLVAPRPFGIIVFRDPEPGEGRDPVFLKRIIARRLLA